MVGVLAPRGRSLGFDFDDIVFIPVATSMRMFNRSSLFRILIEVGSETNLVPVKRAVIDLLAERHRTEDVTVITQDAVLATFDRIFTALTLTVTGIGAISIAVAGILIMNVMLIAVSQRRSEVGLLKAIGAPNSEIVILFLAEAAILSFIGAVAGLIVAAGAVWLIEYIPGIPSTEVRCAGKEWRSRGVPKHL